MARGANICFHPPHMARRGTLSLLLLVRLPRQYGLRLLVVLIWTCLTPPPPALPLPLRALRGIRGSAAVKPLAAPRLKALFQLGAKELNDNRVQCRLAMSYDDGHFWARDVKKHVKWLEVAAANPKPNREGMADPMMNLGWALATGMGGQIELDLDRAEALAVESMRLDASGAEEGQRILSVVAGTRQKPDTMKEAFGVISQGGSTTSRCQSCGKAATGSVGPVGGDVDGGGGEPQAELKKCQGCKRVVYCSRECQRADWKEHSKVCTA